ncbi:MAG: penicillin-binding protein 2 [Candidatus Melainabacteria bacterium]|nr:penicillin-binding protein 2 [Candidatus Melainabacteria bacterium]
MAENIIETSRNKNLKIKVFQGIILILTSILILKLFYLQIFQYKTISQRAQYSTSKISILVAPRGIIYDRNGKILATNKQAISAIVYPNKLKTQKERMEVYEKLTKILKTNPIKLKTIFLKLPENAALPIRLQSNISTEEAIQIVENQHLLPGISIQQEPIRFYPNGSLASHALGYIAQIDEKELAQRPERKLGDLVGKYGIERLFDDILRGVDGKIIVEVNRYGKPVDPEYEHSIININSIPGKNIYLTLDLNLQKSTEEALKKSGTSSAAVVVNPNTGEVLALASYPDFDPNIFTKPLSADTWQNLLNRKAFLNRAVLAYVPGSMWKPVTLITALDAMVVKPNEKFNVSEAYYLGKTRFGDWTSKADTLSLKECLAWSRDTAFYQIGRRLTPEQIKKWGVTLGAGRKTGIEILNEEEGIVPDQEWKMKNLGELWYPGNTLHYAIGQSFLLITPTQAARIYSAIATGFQVPKLQLVKKIHNYNKTNQAPEKYKLDPDFLKIVKDGLELCVEKGTGLAAKLDSIKVAGKTGSAEVPGTGKTHGWFAAYAPAEKPEIVVIVISEKAGHGGTVSAPIAKQILEKYFKVNESKVLAKK